MMKGFSATYTIKNLINFTNANFITHCEENDIEIFEELEPDS